MTIDYAEIFGRAKERPPEVKVEGFCKECGHALEDEINGVCIAFFLHNIPDCFCGGGAASKLRPTAQSLEQLEMKL